MTGSIKTMLLGMAVMLIGIYIQGEASIRMGDLELFFIIIGFIITVSAYFNRGKSSHD
ncbi:hypothetical protein [Halalkalibacter urbisdiaboli]|uniref:hypothetical protein n=1 Tax=Halalkalibacter urbisdiaboli TaxID=1960589 RepID=UPI0013FD76E6|nr:hypothetical protein [Halalkalibacter urbisdiaboli]